ncbi:hypothetical protein CHUAL_012762 [Chamberlinius hualienensis]
MESVNQLQYDECEQLKSLELIPYSKNEPGYYIIFDNHPNLKDVTAIVDTFEQCEFAGETIKNESLIGMQTKLKKVLKGPVNKYSSLLVFLLTTANEQSFLLDSNKNAYDLYKDLIEPIMKEAGPAFVGKPKTFIIQAYKCKKSETHETSIKEASLSIPLFADIFCGYACIPGKEHTEETTFIKRFCDIIRKNGSNYDLESLIVILRGKATTKIPMPISVSTLTKLFYLKTLPRHNMSTTAAVKIPTADYKL